MSKFLAYSATCVLCASVIWAYLSLNWPAWRSLALGLLALLFASLLTQNYSPLSSSSLWLQCSVFGLVGLGGAVIGAAIAKAKKGDAV